MDNIMNNQILSPVDSFILEHRYKILGDRKELEEKIKKDKNVSKPSLKADSQINSQEKNKETTPTILVTDCSNKENILKDQPVLNKVRTKGNGKKDNTALMRNDSVYTTPTQDKIFNERDQEKQRFIDRLIESPDIRYDSDTPRYRQVHTPELPFPVNQRQADIEKLQDLFSESPTYVANTNNVNQFCESYVLSSPSQSPRFDNSSTATAAKDNASHLLDEYVNTFENESTSRTNAQPMSITQNSFAHDQSCKKIVKIGEYSPLNPHFQPQPSVLNFSSGRHEVGSQTSQPSANQRLREKREIEVPMPSKKKSKAVQISADSSSSCVEEDDIEVVGTGFTTALPSIESKVHPETRYPHVRSQHHVETCGGGDPLAAVKLKQELYKTELDKQIREKRKQEEERKRREEEEDEKAQRAYWEQQERLRREFEQEEENKIQNTLQRQFRENLLKEKIRQLQIAQEDEKARKRKEKEAAHRRQKRELENRPVWGPGATGNPASIMASNPFGAAANSRLDPIHSYSKPPVQTAAGPCPTARASVPGVTASRDPHLAPPPSRSRYRGSSPEREHVSPSQSSAFTRDVSPCSVEDCQYTGNIRHPLSRDVSPLRPPIERFRDISPVRPLRDSLPESPRLGPTRGEGALISKAPQELAMPLKRGKHHRVSFIAEPSTSSPPPTTRSRSPSPVLPAVRTHHRMKDLATTVPCPPYSDSCTDTVLKNLANRNVLTQLGQFRRQLYLENQRMNERLRKNGCDEQ
uniref:CCDC66 domain-containing protein n=1 Tax=Cacopsylla melanoneura TaxID=428564 RepID=A0A8D8YDX5_9HEMI